MRATPILKSILRFFQPGGWAWWIAAIILCFSAMSISLAPNAQQAHASQSNKVLFNEKAFLDEAKDAEAEKSYRDHERGLFHQVLETPTLILTESPKPRFIPDFDAGKAPPKFHDILPLQVLNLPPPARC